MLIRTLAAAGALLALAGPAMADECQFVEPVPSLLESAEETVIQVENNSSLPLMVYWADFDGVYQEIGIVEPEQFLPIDTMSYHNFYIEAYAPEGPICIGPVAAESENACQVGIFYDGDVGVDAVNCTAGF